MTRRLLRQPLAVACVLFLFALVVIAVVAPMIWPEVATQRAGDLTALKQGPSGAHLLGTDSLGRDVLTRLLVGTRDTMIGVAEALAVVLALGVPTGLLAGYAGGATDRAIGWLGDLIFAVPGVVLVVVMLSVFPQNLTVAMVTLGVLVSPGLMRVVRASTLDVRQEPYVEAAQVAGLSRSYIMLRHVLPRIRGPIIIQTALLAAAVLLVQTGLAYLGLISAPPSPSWGGMVADGAGAMSEQPWLIWPPGMAIALTILALGLLGDFIRDAGTASWSTPQRMPAHARTRAVRRVAPSGDSGEGNLATLRGVSVGFTANGRTTRVIDGVSIGIRPGETVGLVGESGCGKTTTALTLLGLLGPGGAVETGSVVFDGRDLTGLSERELGAVRGKEIGFVSQEPMVSLDPAFRVGRQLAEAVRTHHGVSRRAADARALELLRMVRLPEPDRVARSYPHELSGGMAQRVSIARALAGDPRLLVADEPTTALDVTVQADILDLLRDLQRSRNMAILLVTHDLGVVADICDRCVVMYAGQVVEQSSVSDLFRAPLHPYTRALLDSNPHGAAQSGSLPTIPGSVPDPRSWPAGCRFVSRCALAAPECEVPVALRRTDREHEVRCVRAA